MYARTVGDRDLTFGVSGMLWEGSLVMIDQETESLWSHLLGEAMQGPLQGTKLEIIPALMTDWATWSASNPDTTVAIMPRSANRYRRGGVAASQSLAICYDDGENAKSWPLPFPHLQSDSPGVIHDRLGEAELLIYWDPSSETAAIYDRRVDERVLTMRMIDGQFRDDETQSRWDPLNGRAVSGELKGKKLKSLAGIISFVSAWHRYHPNSEHWDEGQSPKPATHP